MKDRLSRKEFLKTASLTVGTIVIGAACSNVITDSEFEKQFQNLGKIPKPAFTGSGVSIAGNVITIDLTADDVKHLNDQNTALFIASKSVLVINDAGTYRALTSLCPHAQCNVDSLDVNILVCPCHNSRFKLDGAVTQGPAAVNLANKTINHDNVAKTLTVTV